MYQEDDKASEITVKREWPTSYVQEGWDKQIDNETLGAGWIPQQLKAAHLVSAVLVLWQVSSADLKAWFCLTAHVQWEILFPLKISPDNVFQSPWNKANSTMVKITAILVLTLWAVSELLLWPAILQGNIPQLNTLLNCISAFQSLLKCNKPFPLNHLSRDNFCGCQRERKSLPTKNIMNQSATKHKQREGRAKQPIRTSSLRTGCLMTQGETPDPRAQAKVGQHYHNGSLCWGWLGC